MNPNDSLGKSDRGHAEGFTLVELLVVIGIIGLLISILLPSLNKARELASATKCLSNLRQIGVAMQLYANDNRNMIVPAFYYQAVGTPDTGSVNTGVGVKNWSVILEEGRYFPKQSTTNNSGGSVGRNFVLICASQVDELNGTSPSSKTDQRGAMYYRFLPAGGSRVDTSYALNGWLALANYKWSPFTAQPMSGTAANASLGYTYRLHRFTDFKLSSDTVMMFDGWFLLNGVPNRINARHNGRKDTNLLLGDGHAVTVHNKDGTPDATSTTNDLYDTRALAKYAPYRWRLDQ